MPAKNVGQAGPPAWKPAPEAKQQSTTFRIIAAVLWVLAIGGEAFAIFGLLRQNPVNMVLLIAAIVVIGILAVVGDVLWKRANAMDPASTSEPVRFFVQNQLGAIIGVIAFLPLVILIFLNKNMNGQQKGIAGGIGILALIIAAFMGVSINPPSVEQYSAAQATQMALTSAPLESGTAAPAANATAGAQSSGQFASESAAVIGYTGKDLVYWKVDSTVYHLCAAVSDLQRVNATNNTIYSGTVAEAHAAGMTRLTEKVQEELKQCGYSTSPSVNATP